MTNITELAQSLKAAAIDAKELAIIARYSKGRAAAEKFYALANPANILALVEALENAQQQTTESENRVRKQNRHICELFDDNTALRQRIADLESRTVTVKLPNQTQFDDPLSAYEAIEKCKEALTAQGIKVEAE
ncbi:hypothetical protein SIO57_000746 [Klebsiella pneumoniae]|nr:hypothetical protein [Klebsiella pneumoniae]